MLIKKKKGEGFVILLGQATNTSFAWREQLISLFLLLFFKVVSFLKEKAWEGERE